MTATATRDDLKYSLDDPIGQGVFSTTYQATEVNSNRPVIIKTLATSLRDYPRFPDFTRQFLALSARLASCSHPALPGIWEYFEEDGSPYIVYDRILGDSLANYVAGQGPVDSARAIAWMRQIGEAIAVLHAANLYHLDIQPQNIILRQGTDEAAIVDVGLTCDLSPEIRQTHAQLLAPGYAAPERYVPHQPSSPASDVYSLSATLYFALTGEAPPPAPLLNRIPPDEWQQFPAGVSAAAKVAACRGLAIAPELRPPTVQTWLELLSLPAGVAEHFEAERQAQLAAQRQERQCSGRSGTERQEAERQARLEAERREAERQARLEAERQEAERQARLEAERQEAERQARFEAERQEAERQARLEAERQEAERQARLEAERQEAERQARLEAERQARLEAERQEAEQHAQLEAERQRQVEAARLAAELRDAQIRVPLDELEPPAPAADVEDRRDSRRGQRPLAIARADKPKFPVGALLMTGAIAASAGAGFGLSLRLNRPHEAGSTLWHTEQSFPPRDGETD